MGIQVHLDIQATLLTPDYQDTQDTVPTVVHLDILDILVYLVFLDTLVIVEGVVSVVTLDIQVTPVILVHQDIQVILRTQVQVDILAILDILVQVSLVILAIQVRLDIPDIVAQVVTVGILDYQVTQVTVDIVVKLDSLLLYSTTWQKLLLQVETHLQDICYGIMLHK